MSAARGQLVVSTGLPKPRAVPGVGDPAPGCRSKLGNVQSSGLQSVRAYHLAHTTAGRLRESERGGRCPSLAAIAEAGWRCQVRTLRTAVMADHVHVLVSYRPSTRLADFIRLAKAGSAFRANRRSWGSSSLGQGILCGVAQQKRTPKGGPIHRAAVRASSGPGSATLY